MVRRINLLESNPDHNIEQRQDINANIQQIPDGLVPYKEKDDTEIAIIEDSNKEDMLAEKLLLSLARDTSSLLPRPNLDIDSSNDKKRKIENEAGSSSKKIKLKYNSGIYQNKELVAKLTPKFNGNEIKNDLLKEMFLHLIKEKKSIKKNTDISAQNRDFLTIANILDRSENILNITEIRNEELVLSTINGLMPDQALDYTKAKCALMYFMFYKDIDGIKLLISSLNKNDKVLILQDIRRNILHFIPDDSDKSLQLMDFLIIKLKANPDFAMKDLLPEYDITTPVFSYIKNNFTKALIHIVEKHGALLHIPCLYNNDRNELSEIFNETRDIGFVFPKDIIDESNNFAMKIFIQSYYKKHKINSSDDREKNTFTKILQNIIDTKDKKSTYKIDEFGHTSLYYLFLLVQVMNVPDNRILFNNSNIRDPLLVQIKVMNDEISFNNNIGYPSLFGNIILFFKDNVNPYTTKDANFIFDKIYFKLNQEYSIGEGHIGNMSIGKKNFKDVLNIIYSTENIDSILINYKNITKYIKNNMSNIAIVINTIMGSKKLDENQKSNLLRLPAEIRYQILIESMKDSGLSKNQLNSLIDFVWHYSPKTVINDQDQEINCPFSSPYPENVKTDKERKHYVLNELLHPRFSRYVKAQREDGGIYL